MIANKNCVNCGSRFTYAVPSRNRTKIGPDDRVMRDAQGAEIKIKCRRCRSCGEDYYDDMEPKLSPKSELQKKMVEAALKHIAEMKVKPI